MKTPTWPPAPCKWPLADSASHAAACVLPEKRQSILSFSRFCVFSAYKVNPNHMSINPLAEPLKQLLCFCNFSVLTE